MKRDGPVKTSACLMVLSHFIIHCMNRFFAFIEKHAVAVLIVIALITAFFLVNALGIGLNASYTAFMPYGEADKQFYGGVSGQVMDLGVDDSLVPESVRKAFNVAGYQEGAQADEEVVEGSLDRSVLDDYDFTTLTAPSNEGDEPHNAGTLLVQIGGPELYTADTLNLIQYCINEFVSRPDVGSPYSVMDFVTLDAVGRRLAVKPMSTNESDMWTEEEAAQFRNNIEKDPIIRYFLIGGDGNSMMFEFPISRYNAQIEEEFEEIFKPLEDYGLYVYFNGGPVINFKVMQYLLKDLSVLMVLCIMAILITYYLSFRSKRSVVIPGSLSIIGLIWTLGTMKLMGIDITILNIVTPCMVITLGSAYSIHVISEYYSHFRENGTSDLSPAQTTGCVAGTIILACVTTVVGFLCLCVSQTEGLRDFGVSVGIGISYCAILACVYLPAVLTVTPAPKARQIKHYEEGLLARLVRRLSGVVIHWWYIFIIIFVILTAAFFMVKDEIAIDSNYMSYFPESDVFGQESRAFAKAMGGTNPFSIQITAPEGSTNFFLQHENLEKVRAYEEKILECPDLLQSISFTNYVSFANSLVGGEYGIPDSNGLINMLSRLVLIMKNSGIQEISQIISEDFNTVQLVIQNWDSVSQDLMTTSSITRAYSVMVDNLDMLPEGTSVIITGDPVVSVKFSNRLLSDQNVSTVLSVLIVFMITAIIFRSPIKGLTTIIPVLAGIMINYVFMYLTGIPFDMVTVSFSSIAVGCGVDDAIHFMLRYSRKHKAGDEYDKALGETLVETGRPIILTTVSIVFGMMMLSFGSYTPIRYFGLLMSVTLFGCMVSTLIFLPPFAMLFSRIGKAIRRVRRR